MVKIFFCVILNLFVEFMIRVEVVFKKFGDFYVLKNVFFEVYVGEKVVVCGLFGFGKLILIWCINGLE